MKNGLHGPSAPETRPTLADAPCTTTGFLLTVILLSSNTGLKMLEFIMLVLSLETIPIFHYLLFHPTRTRRRLLPTYFHPSRHTPIPIHTGGRGRRAWNHRFHSPPPSDQEATATIVVDAIPTLRILRPLHLPHQGTTTIGDANLGWFVLQEAGALADHAAGPRKSPFLLSMKCYYKRLLKNQTEPTELQTGASFIRRMPILAWANSVLTRIHRPILDLVLITLGHRLGPLLPTNRPNLISLRPL